MMTSSGQQLTNQRLPFTKFGVISSKSAFLMVTTAGFGILEKTKFVHYRRESLLIREKIGFLAKVFLFEKVSLNTVEMGKLRLF